MTKQEASDSKLIVTTSDGSIDAVLRANGQSEVADALKADAEKAKANAEAAAAEKAQPEGAETGKEPEKKAEDGHDGDEDGEDGGEEQPPEDGQPPRRPRGFKAKFLRTREELELTARERDLERQKSADLDRRLRELEAKANPDKPTEAAPAAGEDLTPPDFADFASEAEYRKALGEYNKRLVASAVSTAMKERDERDLAAKQQATMTEAARRLEASVAEAKKAHADYDERMTEAHQHLTRRGLDLSGAVEQCILTSDAGGELLYALAEDPRELARLCALRPLEAAREIGRIEGRVIAARPDPNRNANPQRPAPKAPINPPRGGSAGVDDDPSKWDQAKYEEKRKAGWGRA